jgi:cytochrome c peroxidase
MKKLAVITMLVAVCCCWQLAGCHNKQHDAVANAKALVKTDMDALRVYLTASMLPAVNEQRKADVLKKHFLQARTLYKKIEWAAEYFMPTTTRFVNGPPLPEVENEENKLFEPEGLQVLEELLYAGDTLDYAEVQRHAKLLLAHVQTYEQYWEAVVIDSAQVLDAVKLQVFRTISLGITGFDAPLARSGIAEATVSLQSLQRVAALFFTSAALDSLFSRAIDFTSGAGSFDDFDRMHFIREYCNPLTEKLVQLQLSRSIPFVQSRRLLKSNAPSLFAANVFDVNAYTPDSTYFMSDAKVLLGEKLFYDRLLSLRGQRNCASCHDSQKAFTDGRTTSASLLQGSLARNVPTLLNAALQPWQFYDMRITNLENQSRDVIENKDEMHGNLSEAVVLLARDSAYSSLFGKSYPGRAINEQNLQNALASYVRSLSLLNSRFDHYMRHQPGAALTPEEKKGFNLFMGKAKCGTCHFAPLFNGTVPPAFIKMESEVLGVPADAAGKQLDTDQGRYRMFAMEPYLRAFKTTTVRNVALTAPYMHNGVYKTLEEVIEFYNKGGGRGLGLDVANQTLPPDSLGLSAAEKFSLLAFLESLTDSMPRRERYLHPL